VNDFDGLDEPRKELPPWDEPGGVRRDSLPHRGALLGLLGSVAFTLSIVSVGCCAPLFLISLPLGLIVWLIARGDVASMRDGLMDRTGLRQTDRAASDGRFAFWLSFTFLAFILLMVAWAMVP
jgi:hypothetical protein